MKIKVLSFLVATSLVGLAAWLVHQNNSPVVNFQNGVASTTKDEVPDPSQADEVPEKYRETVYKGLEYLVKNQFADGHWAGDGGQHPAAMTGLVGIALLMEKERPVVRWGVQPSREVKYLTNILKATDWLMDKSQAGRDGLLFSEHPSETARYMEGHGLATLFLAGAYEHVKDVAHRKKLTNILTHAVKYIVKAQSSQGGWYHTSRVEGHDLDLISATAIQIQALQAAENAGIPVPNEVINHGQDYLRSALGKYEMATGGQNRNRAIETATALACCLKLSRFGGPLKDEVCKKWLKYCQAEIPVGHEIRFGRDELTHYYYAQAVLNNGGTTNWTGYRTAMFDYLQSRQNKDGSWPAGDGIGIGPVYSTAVWCTILQLDNRSHPSVRQERDFITTRQEPGPAARISLARASG